MLDETDVLYPVNNPVLISEDMEEVWSRPLAGEKLSAEDLGARRHGDSNRAKKRPQE